MIVHYNTFTSSQMRKTKTFDPFLDTPGIAHSHTQYTFYHTSTRNGKIIKHTFDGVRLYTVWAKWYGTYQNVTPSKDGTFYWSFIIFSAQPPSPLYLPPYHLHSLIFVLKSYFWKIHKLIYRFKNISLWHNLRCLINSFCFVCTYLISVTRSAGLPSLI